nr:hypothetical protein [Tanacetum cinerariifolium]
MNGFRKCSSCGALNTKSCACSKWGFIDKFVRDPNKTHDSSQRPPHDCPKCGSPVDGLHCRQCALSRKKLKKVWCGNSLDGIFCQRCTCKYCGKGAHYGYNCPSKVSVISNLKPCHNQNVKEFPQTLPSFHPTCYSEDENSFAYDSTPKFVNDSSNVFNPPSQSPMYSYEFYGNDAQYGHDCHLKFYLSIIQNRKIPLCYEDDDDEESATPMRDIIIYELPPCIATTPVLSTKETKDSLIMRDEHLDTITEKESNEFIKSSVKNLVPNPNESENERECDVPGCDDFTTFFNLLFDVDDNFSSSYDKSFSDEDIPKEIYSNPLFDEEIISIKIDPHHFNVESGLIESLLNQDSLIISSSKIDYLLDEYAGELIFLKSIPPGIDEADCNPEEEIRLIEKLLYDNSSPYLSGEINSENSDAIIKSFSPSPIPLRIVTPLWRRSICFLLLMDQYPQ